MKATGIVRRIDDLGRVVIPKEIRRTLRLREGTPLEIFTDREGEIILKKYSPMVELTAFASQYAEAMAQSTGLLVCITDRDQVIAVSGGPKKDYLQKPVSRQLETLIGERQIVTAGKDDRNFIPIISEEPEGVTAQVIAPIICEGDAIGAVALLSRESRIKFGEPELVFWDVRWRAKEILRADVQGVLQAGLAAAVQSHAAKDAFFVLQERPCSSLSGRGCVTIHR